MRLDLDLVEEVQILDNQIGAGSYGRVLECVFEVRGPVLGPALGLASLSAHSRCSGQPWLAAGLSLGGF